VTGLLQRVEENIQSRRLLRRGQSVLVAVSGGLDSMVLLQLLRELSIRHRWRLTVAHFNHRLRGRSSDADEKLVRRTAQALRLPFVAGRTDVKDFARKSGLSIEMAARKLRHEFLARVARERKIRTVALAHHADDQVELFFLRLLRGAGGEGLAGMNWRSPSPVDAKIKLVRPLLDASKDELHRLAREKKIRFREDATNARLEMPRNRVRNELLPLLRRRYQSALTKTVLRLMEIVGAEAEFVSETAQRWLEMSCRSRGLPGRSIGVKTGDEAQIKSGKREAESGKSETARILSCSFDNLPIAVQRRVLQLQLLQLGIPADFELVEQLRKAAEVQISAGPGFFVLRDAAGRVGLRTQSPAPFNASEAVLKLAGRAGGAMFDGVRLDWRLPGGAGFVRPRSQAAREIFDADRVGGSITLRHWRPGDRFQPIGLKSPVKLQDLFTNLKVPRARRRELVVAAAAGGEIFWVEGLRISENFKLTPQTKRRLIWRWRHPAGSVLGK
jgi:tRNA(Ile)-lysidine synthase